MNLFFNHLQVLAAFRITPEAGAPAALSAPVVHFIAGWAQKGDSCCKSWCIWYVVQDGILSPCAYANRTQHI